MKAEKKNKDFKFSFSEVFRKIFTYRKDPFRCCYVILNIDFIMVTGDRFRCT